MNSNSGESRCNCKKIQEQKVYIGGAPEDYTMDKDFQPFYFVLQTDSSWLFIGKLEG